MVVSMVGSMVGSMAESICKPETALEDFFSSLRLALFHLGGLDKLERPCGGPLAGTRVTEVGRVTFELLLHEDAVEATVEREPFRALGDRQL